MEGRQWMVGGKAVRPNDLARSEFFRDAVAIDPRESSSGHKSRPVLPVGIHHPQHGCRIDRAASSFPGADAAEKSVVPLDQTAQLVATIAVPPRLSAFAERQASGLATQTLLLGPISPPNVALSSNGWTARPATLQRSWVSLRTPCRSSRSCRSHTAYSS